jgi:hypothetical protein
MSLGRKIVVLFLCLTIVVGIADGQRKTIVAADGFPTGQSTPEGAAADLARAFISKDVGSFRALCIRPYGDGPAKTEYLDYLNGVSTHLGHHEKPSPDNPKKISKVFAARHLSHGGPASTGYALFNFRDVMFVDLEVILNSNQKFVRRTMVVLDSDGKWYVHPVPDVSPQLSYGLYDESKSVRLFHDEQKAEGK